MRTFQELQARTVDFGRIRLDLRSISEALPSCSRGPSFGTLNASCRCLPRYARPWKIDNFPLLREVTQSQRPFVLAVGSYSWSLLVDTHIPSVSKILDEASANSLANSQRFMDCRGKPTLAHGIRLAPSLSMMPNVKSIHSTGARYRKPHCWIRAVDYL